MRSTKQWDSKKLVETVVTSNVTNFVIVANNQHKEASSPLTGRLSRKGRLAAKELGDADYSARMAQARALLAADMEDIEGQSLASLRMKRGFSQTALAKKIGTSQAHIARIEGGQLSLRWDTVIRLADALGVSTDILRKYIDMSVAELSTPSQEIIVEL